MNDKPFSIGIIADVQYADEAPFKNRHYRNAPLKLRPAIERFNYENVDFVVNLGDLIDRDFDNFNRIQSLLSTLKVPLWNIAGNHDYEVDNDKKKEVLAKLSIPGEGYYAFDHQQWRMIFLNGCEVSLFANSSGEDAYMLAEQWLENGKKHEQIQANAWNGGIGEKQKQWLISMLDDAKCAQLRTAVFCHYPIYPVNKHNLLNEPEVMAVLSEYQLDIWLSGHNHEGNFGQLFDAWFVSLKGMVETEDSPTFAIIEFSRENVLIRGFGEERSYNLTLTNR